MTPRNAAVTLTILMSLVLGCARRATPQPVQSTEPVALPPGLSNAIYIEDMGKSGSQPQDRPFTVSRTFSKGEFPACVKALADGSEAETQCDVKTRWPDGSVRHALISFWARLAPGSSIQVEFIPQDCPPPAEGMSKSDVLSALNGRWGATLETVARGKDDAPLSQAADVRAMLEDWDGQSSDSGIRYWMKGPLVTQLIVEDRSPALKFDFGWQTALQGADLGVSITPTDMTVKLSAKTAARAAEWPMPTTGYIGVEKIKFCSLSGDTLIVCPKGRGVEGTTPRSHYYYRTDPTVVADTSWEAASDDDHKSLHPVFVVTLYRDWPGVHIQAILENTWTNKLQNQSYTARLRRGADAGETVWEKSLVQVAGSRWRRSFWDGQALPPIRIDHNLPYLAFTGAVPNYDREINISSKLISSLQSSYGDGGKWDPTGFGNWEPHMGNGGARPDVGVLPTWQTAYLRTFDSILWQMVAGGGDVSGSMPVHFRESLNTGTKYLAGRDEPAFGRILSIDARPTVLTYDGYRDYAHTQPQDRLMVVGPIGCGDWGPDVAHHPSTAYLPYILSGDWYYLEEMNFWGAYVVANPNYSERQYSAGVVTGGPDARNDAWALRTLAQVASSNPDQSPEKDYFTQKLRNNIAVREGFFDITDRYLHQSAPGCQAPCSQTLWRFGRDVIGGGLANPLRLPNLGGSGGHIDPTVVDPAKTFSATSPWMNSYLYLAIGHVADLGFDEILPYKKALYEGLIAQLRHPEYNPYLAAVYRMPVRRMTDQKFFDSWAELRDAFQPAVRDKQSYDTSGGGQSYAHILCGAASYTVGMQTPDGFSGTDAYNFVRSRIQYSAFESDPTWSMAPKYDGGQASGQSWWAKASPKWLRRTPNKAQVRSSRISKH
ncbi:MAG: hypothetical protein HZB13_17300 [Acidobacteria bacterium]|nr:hypothetical protein [Acidobacteriota bacterium]